MAFTSVGNIVAGFVPLDLQTQRDSQWVTITATQKLLVVLFKGTGTDGDDPIFALQQAKDTSGTGVKALTFTTIYTKQGADVQAVAAWTEVTQSAYASYTNTNGHLQCIWMVEVNGNDLDRDNLFNSVRATLNDTGTNPQLGCVLYFIINDKDIFDNAVTYAANYVVNPNPVIAVDTTVISAVNTNRSTNQISTGEAFSVVAGANKAVKKTGNIVVDAS